MIGIVLAISWHQARRSGESCTGKMPGAFLWKLRRMLIDPRCATSLKWSSSGKEILILDEHALVKQLPRYFNHNKVSSFQRQMKYYCFETKKVVGFQKVVYMNPRFRADSGADEIAQIKRKPNKSNKRKVCSGNSETDCTIDNDLALVKLVEWPFCTDDELVSGEEFYNAFDVDSTPNKKARRTVSPPNTPKGTIHQMTTTTRAMY